MTAYCIATVEFILLINSRYIRVYIKYQNEQPILICVIVYTYIIMCENKLIQLSFVKKHTHAH